MDHRNTFECTQKRRLINDALGDLNESVCHGWTIQGEKTLLIARPGERDGLPRSNAIPDPAGWVGDDRQEVTFFDLFGWCSYAWTPGEGGGNWSWLPGKVAGVSIDRYRLARGLELATGFKIAENPDNGDLYGEILGVSAVDVGIQALVVDAKQWRIMLAVIAGDPCDFATAAERLSRV